MASTKNAGSSRKVGASGKSGKSGKSNVPLYVAALLGLTVYAVGTYVVVEVAGGTEVSSTDSNTPNGVVPGPPAAR